MDRYIILISIFKSFEKEGLITKAELKAINERLKEKYNPIYDLII